MTTVCLWRQSQTLVPPIRRQNAEETPAEQSACSEQGDGRGHRSIPTFPAEPPAASRLPESRCDAGSLQVSVFPEAG